MRFSVLGTMEIHDGGTPITLKAPKQRTLLAILIARAGRPVAGEDLIETLWSGNPPASARKALAWHLLNLRKTLGDKECITLGPDGYALAAHTTDVDGWHFEELVKTATGDPHETLLRLTRALELWRGNAFQDFDGELFRHEARRLDELRVTALDTRGELGLSLGHHAALAPELAELVARYPYRESFRAQLMLAHYRNGRHADALAVYQDGKALLDRELGLDPGPRLRQLEQWIRRRDPSLDLQTATTSTAAEPIPAQLPASSATFTGRHRHIDAVIHAGRDAGHAIVVTAVDGMAGVGKTALAVQAAHRLIDEYPGGQLFIDLHGYSAGITPVTPADALERLLHGLGVPESQIPTDVDDRAALYRSTVARADRMIVVLDNAADETQVTPLLPAGPTHLVIITSRRAMAGLDDAQRISLDLPGTDEAVEMFVKAAGIAPETASEWEQVAAVVELCGRLPLAIRIAAARLHQRRPWTLRELHERLSLQRDRLRELEAGDRSVAAAFHVSYLALDETHRRLFRLLALASGRTVTVEAAAAPAGHGLDHTEDLLEHLVDVRLLDNPHPGRYVFHDLIAEFAAKALHADEGDEAREAATLRFLDHYLHTAHTAALLFHPQREPLALRSGEADVHAVALADDTQALAWLSDNYGHLLSAIALADDNGLDTYVWQLAWTLTTFFDRRGHWNDWAATTAVVLRATERLGDPARQAQAHSDLARAHSLLGRPETTRRHFQAALRLFKAAGDELRLAHTHLNYSRTFEREQDWDSARTLADRASQIYTRIGNDTGRAHALNAIGWYATRQGEHRQALAHCQAALELFRQGESRPGEAATWDSLGVIHQKLANLDESAYCFERALELSRTIGNLRFEADVLSHLGDTHNLAGRRRVAEQAWRQALDILADLGSADSELAAKLRQPVPQPQ